MACRKPLLFYDSGVALIDSRKGVTDRIVTLLGELAGLAGRTVASEDRPPAAELYLHGGLGEEERYRAFAARFDLHFGGI
ncbi:MAG: hypothetical protein V3T35_04945, partial [Spirochaetia bacterium]